MKRMLFAVLAVAMLFAVPVMAFEVTTVDVDKSSYGYIRETTVTMQGPVVTQATSGNENAVATGKGFGVAISGSEQSNSAFALGCGPMGLSKTSSEGLSGAMSLGNAGALGANAGLSTAQTGIMVFDITKQGAGYHNSVNVDILKIKK